MKLAQNAYYMFIVIVSIFFKISFYKSEDVNKNVNIIIFLNIVNRGWTFVFCLKNFGQIIRFMLLFLFLAVVMGGGWVFKDVGPGRGEAKKLKLGHEDASIKRYEHFYNF